jgi:O-methyltransferase
MMAVEPSGAPEQRFTLLRRFLPRRMQPFLRGLKKRYQAIGRGLDEPFRSVFPFTQMSQSRQQNLVRMAKIVEDERIPGAIVECGVLDGGSAALMAWATSGSGREVHLFDAWRGLPESTSQDGPAARKWVGEVVGSPKRVVRILKKLGVRMNRVHFHKGWFHETFPHADIAQIALMNIDCDFYEPTQLCLQAWGSKVVDGGFVQFDDYKIFTGTTQAVDEYLSTRPSLVMQTYGVGGVAHYFRKPAPSPSDR